MNWEKAGISCPYDDEKVAEDTKIHLCMGTFWYCIFEILFDGGITDSLLEQKEFQIKVLHVYLKHLTSM